MKKFILIRHSYAEAGGFSGSDFDRKLTNSGIEIAKQQAQILKSKHIFPELFISSNAERALQTTRIFSKELGLQKGILQLAYLYEHYTTVQFFNMINEFPADADIIALVGHNPTISQIASRLDNDVFLSFKPGSMGVFDCGDSWESLEVGGSKMTDYFSS